MTNTELNTIVKRRLCVLSGHVSSHPKSMMQVTHHKTQFTPINSKLVSQFDDFIILSEEVQKTLATGGPIVALESTIITHGMPYPANVDTAIQVENEIRTHGATPATIAIMNGKIHVGLSKSQIETLAKQKDVVKCSRRDLAQVCSRGLWGSTTVAATMIVCHMVGISIFVTGGIGGVHRGAEQTMDISADLLELGKTPVAVICAGVKSILDIPKTLEVLETQGVTVTSYQTDEFPAFFTRRSGCKTTCRLNSPLECAKLIRTSHRFNLQNGILIAVPVPEKEEANAQHMNIAIEKAIMEAEEQGVSGKDATPFLLKRINELSGGESLQSNIALIKNNARIGAQIAVEFSKLQHNYHTEYSQLIPNTVTQYQTTGKFKKSMVTCIGGSVVDITGKSNAPLILESSNPGETFISMGGVARNVGEALGRMGANPFIISAVGTDTFGKIILNDFEENLHLSTRGIIQTSDYRTAIYISVLDVDGNLSSAIADMDILNASITPQVIDRYIEDIKKTNLVFMDANLDGASLKHVALLCQKHCKPLFFEPTSVTKAKKAVHAGILPYITYMKPNKDELLEMASLVASKEIQVFEQAIQVMLEAGIKVILCTAGPNDVIAAHISNGEMSMMKVAVAPVKNVVSVNGAGDNFCAGFIFGVLKNLPIDACIRLGCDCALLALQTREAVNKKLNEAYIKQVLRPLN